MVPELFYKDVSESLYIENWGTISPRVAWIVTNFVYLGLLPHFNVILSAKCLCPHMTSETLYVKSLPTPVVLHLGVNLPLWANFIFQGGKIYW